MKKMNIGILMAGAILITACGGEKKSENTEENTTTEEVVVQEEASKVAMAQISSASGSTLTGEATFTDNGDGTVTLDLDVQGATPGEHALHLHQNGDCSAPDATSAGGHWNPTMTDHGKRAEGATYHAGDIDNLVVGADSTGTLTMTVKGWSVGGDENTNVIGRAIIIHAQADDFVSQPAGAAGSREGCGVIVEKAN